MADKKKKTEAKSDTKSDKSADTGSKSEESSGEPSKGYSRGENQKPVTQAYRSNWESIFGKKRRGGRA